MSHYKLGTKNHKARIQLHCSGVHVCGLGRLLQPVEKGPFLSGPYRGLFVLSGALHPLSTVPASPDPCHSPPPHPHCAPLSVVRSSPVEICQLLEARTPLVEVVVVLVS